jgi:uncharacterized membrane protein
VRNSSIDLLRSCAIVVMIVVHFCENLAGYTPGIAGLGAPLFMFLSGVSYRLWLNAQLKRDRSDSEIAKISIRRGLFLFGLGFVFNILVWSPQDAFNWDILTLIGTGLIVLNLVRFIPQPATWTIGTALILVAPVVQYLADWKSYWTNGYFDPDYTYADIFQGFLVTGYFPVVPWIAFPMIGFIVSTNLFGSTMRTKEVTVVPGGIGQLFRFSILLMAISCGLLWIRGLISGSFLALLPNAWSMFPPSLEYTIGILGFTIFLFLSAHLWIDRRLTLEQLAGVNRFAAVFGKYSLSFYLLHHLAHLWPLWIYGALTSESFDDYWMKATSVPGALFLAVVFLVFSFFLFRWIERHQGPSVEKLMRWLCD